MVTIKGYIYTDQIVECNNCSTILEYKCEDVKVKRIKKNPIIYKIFRFIECPVCDKIVEV